MGPCQPLGFGNVSDHIPGRTFLISIRPRDIRTCLWVTCDVSDFIDNALEQQRSEQPQKEGPKKAPQAWKIRCLLNVSYG